MKAALCSALLLASLSAVGAPAGGDFRAAVVIGSNAGDADEVPLEYAEADAERFHRMLLEVGQVERERAYLVIGGGAEAAKKAIAEAKGRLAELSARGPTALIVYISAHADETSIHLEGSRLELSELRAALDEAPAGLRLAIIDACRTKAPSRKKGGHPGPPVSVRLESSAKVKGSVWMMAAGEGEPAQEWSYLRGSLFTHHLLGALRGLGDFNQDQTVSLTEAYAYTFRHTFSQSVVRRDGAPSPAGESPARGIVDAAR